MFEDVGLDYSYYTRLFHKGKLKANLRIEKKIVKDKQKVKLLMHIYTAWLFSLWKKQKSGIGNDLSTFQLFHLYLLVLLWAESTLLLSIFQELLTMTVEYEKLMNFLEKKIIFSVFYCLTVLAHFLLKQLSTKIFFYDQQYWMCEIT